MREPDQRWRDALIAVLPSAARRDESILDFLVEELVTSGIHPSDAGDTDGTDDTTEDALHSILAEHLATLLDLTPAEAIFLVRDLLDTYRSPPVDPDGDGAGPGKGSPATPGECELCDRPVSLTIHHLIPRSEHDHFLRRPPASLLANQSERSNQSQSQGQGLSKGADPGLTSHDMLIKYRAYLCRPCHSAIHRIIPDNREMGAEYWSVERLMRNEDVQRWIGYARGMKQGMGNYQKMGLRYKR
jgi:5-methylcytosine-specific restriction endonuclease McrA